MYFVIFKTIILLFVGVKAYNDLPCAQRYTDDSVVCVCNASYCDTITRERLVPGQYMSYTSSRSGFRFRKTSGNLLDHEYVLDDVFDMVLLLQTERMYQDIEGFGGSVTDSAAMNWKSLPPAVRQQLVKTYFGEHGIEYNMIRVPIGSSDFSTRPWTYNSEPANDAEFTNFTLSYEDKQYKIPLIHEILKRTTDELEVVASTWSPPNWMLEVDGPINMKSIKNEFYQAYADYHCKFAELYKKQGINIWGMTPANEPLTVVSAGVINETTFWTGPSMANFIVKNLGPTIRKCSVENIKILGVDDQRFALPLFFNALDIFNSDFDKYIDGIALHFYADTITSPGVIPRSMRGFQNKFVIVTEGCVGSLGENAHKVIPGSWDRAKMYIRDILENLNYNVVGWIDWNLCLNEQGGPTWTGNYVDAPIIVDASKKEFFKQPIYYAFGQFSKFLPRGSRRMRTVKEFPAPDPYLDIQDIEGMGQEYFDHVAFLTPHGTVVTIIHNEGPQKKVMLRLNKKVLIVELEAESITTIEFMK